MTEKRTMRDWLELESEAQTALGKRGGAFTTELEASQFQAFYGRSPQTILDVGANVGAFAAACRAIYPDAKIIAVEPSKTNIPRLETRFADDSAISVVPAAAAEQPGRATLYANEPGSGLASLTRRDLRHLNIPFEAQEEVTLLTIDSIVDDYLQGAPVDLIKLDVEGNELDCLKGATRTLETCRAVQFEFGGCNIDTRTYLRDFFHFFTARGFELYRIAPSGLVHLRGYREHLESFMTSNYLACRGKEQT